MSIISLQESLAKRDSKGCFIKGTVPYMKGKRHSLKTKEKISKKNKGRFSGENHPMYGKHPIPWNKDKTGLQVAWNKDKKVQCNTGRTHFKKGQIPWNKDLHICLNPDGGFKKGHIPWNQGKHHSEQTKIKLSKANSGENSPCWKGGVTSNLRLSKPGWRAKASKIRKRDNQQCQLFGGLGYDVHHIIPYTEDGTDKLNNLITLCRTHHSKIEKSKFQSFWKFYLSKHIRNSLN